MENVKKVFTYVKQNRTTSRRCKCCDSIVLKEPRKECYPYFCPKCDKYLFEIDTLESYRVATEDDIIDLLQNTYFSTKRESIV